MSGSGKPVKVLFYTFTPRAFRSTLIGHLYEICQAYPTILLAEELDDETARILRDKKLFPYLERIIPVRQFTASDSIFSQNRRLSRQLKRLSRPIARILSSLVPTTIPFLNSIFLGLRKKPELLPWLSSLRLG